MRPTRGALLACPAPCAMPVGLGALPPAPSLALRPHALAALPPSSPVPQYYREKDILRCHCRIARERSAFLVG
ncbi:hypothetical protein K469DRAFT_721181 [Zopfia rhizophila CBS 207.26]|uniref:Uncharacterized protein n=1 Tax=Zopfia rhizophila CBS 207.26 TaxID=1314779 RepID=A0A6A6DFB4_9PEZI|nr:hypothetical protein K469DRAFT_721181 [Zopfia rhizophila CBS 207.26]